MAGALPEPGARFFAGSAVVLLIPLGHHGEVIVLRSGDQLADRQQGLSLDGNRRKELEKSCLGDHDAPPEADHGQLASGHQLVGEGSGDAEQRTDFGHAED
jgi:hypothetical protein